MGLKVVIVILFIGLVISLFTSLSFLIKDQGDSHRAWKALGVRISLAALLMATVTYGIFTGKLSSNAPWDARYASKITPPAENPEPSQKPQ